MYTTINTIFQFSELAANIKLCSPYFLNPTTLPCIHIVMKLHRHSG